VVRKIHHSTSDCLRGYNAVLQVPCNRVPVHSIDTATRWFSSDPQTCGKSEDNRVKILYLRLRGCPLRMKIKNWNNSVLDTSSVGRIFEVSEHVLQSCTLTARVDLLLASGPLSRVLVCSQSLCQRRRH
jgi:hypothetical protein